MKKIIFFISVIVAITAVSGNIIANDIPKATEVVSEQTVAPSDIDDVSTENEDKTQDISGLNDASEEVIGSVTKKDKRIAELSDKYNDKTLGGVAYFLEMVRYYSTPIFFVFLTIGAFNFFIIGNKKLDKKEQGFGWITACIIGWVFFQCIPLIFALLAM